MARKKDKRHEKGSPAEPPVQKGGWTLYAHPELLNQIGRLELAAQAESDPQGNATKVLAWVSRAIFDDIPSDPTRAKYRLGGALGGITHWFRDKYAGRFRLFFRYDSRARIIIYGWVNDAETFRTYGSRTDAYAVFKDRLTSGKPPDSWDTLLREASTPAAVRRMKGGSEAPG